MLPDPQVFFSRPPLSLPALLRPAWASARAEVPAPAAERSRLRSRGTRAPAHPAILRRDAVAAPVSAAPMCLARRRAGVQALQQLGQTPPASRARPSPEA